MRARTDEYLTYRLFCSFLFSVFLLTRVIVGPLPNLLTLDRALSRSRPLPQVV